MIPLTAHNAKLYADKATEHFQVRLLRELPINPYLVEIRFNRHGGYILVEIKYKGEEFDPRSTVGMSFPENYLGGGGSEVIGNNRDKISYSYKNGTNYIVIRFEAEDAEAGFNRVKVRKVVTNYRDEYDLGWKVFYAWRLLGTKGMYVDRDDLMNELVSNICRHSNIKEGKEFLINKEDMWMLFKESKFSYRIAGVATADLIRDIINELHAENKPISVNLVIEGKASITVNDNLFDELYRNSGIRFNVSYEEQKTQDK